MTSDMMPTAREREQALRTVADRLLDDAAELLDLLAVPELRDVTIGELLESVPRGGTGRTHLRPVPSDAGTALRARLSERELEVVRLIVEGLSNKEISGRLALSDKTVKNHISHILAKLKLTARTQVAVLALRAGIV